MLSVVYYSDPPPKDVDSFGEVFFYFGASIYSRSGMVGNVSSVLFWVVYSVYVTTFFLSRVTSFSSVSGGTFKKGIKIKALV